MRARQFTKPQISEETLNEINMSPSSLRQFVESHPIAEQITAGFELELCFEKIGTGSSYGMEDDYIGSYISLEDLKDMFSEYVSRRDHGYERMENDYMESWDERVNDEMDMDEVEEIARRRALEQLSDDDVEERAKELAQAEEGADPNDYFDQAQEELVDETWEDYRDEAMEEHMDDLRENLDYSFSDWLDSNYRYLSELAYDYNLDVPFTEDSGSAPFDMSEMEHAGDELSNAVGLPIRVSDDYHGTRRGDYMIIEPDGSIESDYDHHGAAEVISPPLPLKSALTVYRRTVIWAKEHGGYTNDSTGLHFNISSPDVTNFDYLKMALLLGDKHLLSVFEREHNSYCRSAIEKIVYSLRQGEYNRETGSENSVPRAQQIMEYLRKHTYDMAKIIAQKAMSSYGDPSSGNWSTEKYSSLHWKGNYLEVRSMGGSHILENPELAINGIYRIVRVWASAVDPNLDREEYLKKLYKMTSGVLSDIQGISPEKSITLSRVLADYIAGRRQDIKPMIDEIRRSLERSQQQRKTDQLVGLQTTKLPQPNPQMNLNFDK